MGIALVGLNPFVAPASLWRRAALAPDEHAAELARLRALPGVSEAVLLAGARRLECYVVLEDGRDSFEVLAGFLAARAGVAAGECMPYLYMAEGLDAAGHLLNVVCGQDSFAFEDQLVLDQARDAADLARARRALGPLLGQLFARAIALAERPEMGIGAGGEAVELSSVALGIIERVFDGLSRREVLLVGGGKACELAARHLIEAGVRHVSVIGTAAERTGVLARSLGAAVRQPSDLEECLAGADIVLSSTSSAALAIDARLMRRVHRARRGRLMLLVDFADPARVDSACADIDDVYLYDRHDLMRISDRASLDEGRSSQMVSELIAEEAASFAAWLEEAAPSLARSGR